MRAEWRPDRFHDRPLSVRAWARLKWTLRAKWPETAALFALWGLASWLLVGAGFVDPLATLIVIPALLLQWLGFAELAPPPADLTPLMDEPSALDQVPVDVLIIRQGVQIGADCGLLSVVDGWLLFSGLETQFSLCAVGTSIIGSERLEDLGLPLSYRSGLILRDGTIVAYRGHGSIGSESKMVAGWIKRAVAVEGVEVLPPVLPQQRQVTVAQLRFARAVAMAGTAGVAMAVWALAHQQGPATFVLCLIVPFIVTIGPLLRSLDGLSRLRQVGRQKVIIGPETGTDEEGRLWEIDRRQLRQAAIMPTRAPVPNRGPQYAQWRLDKSKGKPLWTRLNRAKLAYHVSGAAVFSFIGWRFFSATGSTEPLGFLLFSLLWVLPSMEVDLFAPSVPRDVRFLGDDPPAIPQAQTDVMIYRDGALIGSDRGLLSVVDGWLVFSGIESSFQLGAQFCHRTKNVPRRLSMCPEPSGSVFIVRVGESSQIVVFSRPSSDWSSIRTLRDWYEERASVDGQPLLPPNMPQERVWTTVRAMRIAEQLRIGMALIGLVVFTSTPFESAGMVWPVWAAGFVASAFVAGSRTLGLRRWERVLKAISDRHDEAAFENTSPSSLHDPDAKGSSTAKA